MRVLVCCVCRKRLLPDAEGAPSQAEVKAHARCARLR
jgi:hypothetical protein